MTSARQDGRMPTLATSHGSLAYLDLGPRDAPVVVFVHGLLVDHRLWRPVADRLAATHRVILPDWPMGAHRTAMDPGADLSPGGIAALVADLLERLDLRDVTLVGNDSGGGICQLVATRHPERLGRLVLTNCDAFEVFPPKEFAYLMWLGVIPGLSWVAAKSMRRFARLRRMERAFGALTREPIDDALLVSWLTPSAEQGPIRRDLRALIRGVTPTLLIDAAAALPRFGKPALLVWGTADRFFTIGLAERLAAALGGAPIERIEGARTFVAIDAPDRVAAAIARFTGTQRLSAAG
jgi:pimeloyl-ACP methyl ester carboxylesterase